MGPESRNVNRIDSLILSNMIVMQMGTIMTMSGDYEVVVAVSKDMMAIKI